MIARKLYGMMGAVLVGALALASCSTPTQTPVPLPPIQEPTFTAPAPSETPVAPSPVPTVAVTIEPTGIPSPSAAPTESTLTFSGKGNAQVALKGYDGNGAFVHATHDGISTFNVLNCDDQGKKTGELIMYAGKYDGIKSLDVINPTLRTKDLCVTADGNWTLTLFSLTDYSQLRTLDSQGRAKSTNSQVFVLTGKEKQVTMNYQPTLNLPAYVEINTFQGSAGSVLASKGAGDFLGQVFLLSPGTTALEIDADYGFWSIVVQ